MTLSRVILTMLATINGRGTIVAISSVPPMLRVLFKSTNERVRVFYMQTILCSVVIIHTASAIWCWAYCHGSFKVDLALFHGSNEISSAHWSFRWAVWWRQFQSTLGFKPLRRFFEIRYTTLLWPTSRIQSSSWLVSFDIRQLFAANLVSL